MADMTQVYTALRNAHAAGDTEAAQKLAAYIQSQPVGEAPPSKPQELGGLLGWNRRMGQTIADTGYGALRGVKDVIDTGALGLATGYDKLTGGDQQTLGGLVSGQRQGEAARVQAMNEAGKQQFESEYGDNTAASVGRLGGNVLATAPIGGVLGGGVKLLSQSPKALALAEALRTGGMAANGAGMGTRIAGGAISGAAMSGAINPEDVGTGAAIGGALPAVVKGAGMVGSKIASKMQVAAERAQLAQKAKTLGIDIPADRIANSKILDAMAASLDYVPFSGRIATETRMNNQIKKALSNTFGENSDSLTKDLFAKTQAKLGQGFDDFLTKNKIKVDQQLSDDLKTNLTKAKNELSADNYRIVENQVKDLWGKIDNGIIDGNAAYNVKKTLDRLGRGNGNEAFHAKEIRDSIMDGVLRSAPPDEAAAFVALKRKYANLKSLQKLAGNSAEGDISMARLGNIDSRNPEVLDLAKIAATFAKGRESPHGAMQRVAMGGGVAALGGGALAGVAVPVAVGLTAGRAANMALNSNSLRNLLVGQPTSKTNRLSDLIANPATRAALISAQSR